MIILPLAIVFCAGALCSCAVTSVLLKRTRRDESKSVRYLLDNAPAEWSSNDLYFRKVPRCGVRAVVSQAARRSDAVGHQREKPPGTPMGSWAFLRSRSI